MFWVVAGIAQGLPLLLVMMMLMLWCHGLPDRALPLTHIIFFFAAASILCPHRSKTSCLMAMLWLWLLPLQLLPLLSCAVRLLFLWLLLPGGCAGFCTVLI